MINKKSINIIKFIENIIQIIYSTQSSPKIPSKLLFAIEFK